MWPRLRTQTSRKVRKAPAAWAGPVKGCISTVLNTGVSTYERINGPYRSAQRTDLLS
jgi:hypothetical protein